MRSTTIITIALLALVVFAPLVAAAPSISLTSKWVEGGQHVDKVTAKQGETKTVMVFVNSDSDFQISLDVVQESTVKKEILKTTIPANLNQPYLNPQLKVDTSGLAGGEYKLIVRVDNGKDSDTKILSLDVQAAPKPTLTLKPLKPATLTVKEGDPAVEIKLDYSYTGKDSLEFIKRQTKSSTPCDPKDAVQYALCETTKDSWDVMTFLINLVFPPDYELKETDKGTFTFKAGKLIAKNNQDETLYFRFRVEEANGDVESQWQYLTVTVQDADIPPVKKDTDKDGIPDDKDNCPVNYNPKQEDQDNDKIGDVCDPDVDGDKIPNDQDNCPAHFNPTQADKNGDGIGDVCDPHVNKPDTPKGATPGEVTIASVGMSSDTVEVGEYLHVAVHLQNEGDVDMDDAHVSILAYDLGIMLTSNEFDLDSGRKKTVDFYIQIPADANEGDYDVMITAQNDNGADSVYREVSIV